MQPPCGPKCRFSCSSKFTAEQRQNIFESYWALGCLQRQRDFLSSCVMTIAPVYRRLKVNAASTRKPNFGFYLMNNGQNIRVCKLFLLNTLAISQRVLRTVSDSKIDNDGVALAEGRGKHSNHAKHDTELLESVRIHINSVPRIESHYLRANTTREYIDGGLTVAELHRDYKKERLLNGKEAASYDLYYRIFNTEFNISFFVPKKDQCELCESYKNAMGDQKTELEPRYNEHQNQKKKSREEKAKDIENCREENNTVVAIYDLQAVLPVPTGEVSAFYYKSKLNCMNFTVTDVKNDETSCYFWHEALANRGVNEIGSCVYRFLEDISRKHPNCDVIFYSDNCCSQQKNKFMFSLYYYATLQLNIRYITHKFLIRGHTQNEEDNAHSVIEKAVKRAKKSGPIYIPDHYAQIIRTTKKSGKPYKVTEMNFNDFHDLKSLAAEVRLNMAKNLNGEPVKTSDIKMIRFSKDSDTYAYKNSYEEDWIEAEIHKQGRGSRKFNTAELENVSLQQAYTSKIGITGRLKTDLKSLINSNIVPNYYARFNEGLFVPYLS